MSIWRLAPIAVKWLNKRSKEVNVFEQWSLSRLRNSSFEGSAFQRGFPLDASSQIATNLSGGSNANNVALKQIFAREAEGSIGIHRAPSRREDASSRGLSFVIIFALVLCFPFITFDAATIAQWHSRTCCFPSLPCLVEDFMMCIHNRHVAASKQCAIVVLACFLDSPQKRRNDFKGSFVERNMQRSKKRWTKVNLRI